MRYQCAVGWIAHDTVGVTLAFVFVALARDGWLTRPTALPALGYGLGTVLFPFLILQPALGLGVASPRSPNPWLARSRSLVTHRVFGVGLYVCALGLSYAMRPGKDRIPYFPVAPRPIPVRKSARYPFHTAGSECVPCPRVLSLIGIST